MLPQVELFPFIFWKNLKTPKRRFEINWPSLVFTNRITREMEEEFTHALYQLSSPDHVAKKIVTEILTDDSDGSEEVSSLSFSQELGSRLQVNLCQKLFFLQNMGRTCCVQKFFWMLEIRH